MATSKYTKRMAAAAGSLAGLVAAPAATEAAVIHVTGSPVSLATSVADGTSVTWDIDGDTTSDFRIWKFSAFGALFIGSDTASGGQGNGRGMVAPFSTDNILAQFASDSVGASDIFGRAGGSAQNGYYAYRNAMSLAGGAIGYDFNYGFAPGDNFVGFRFDDGVGGGFNYGYAVINFDTVNGIVTISEWWYETTEDLAIHVGSAAVPEPSSLALLACGAAGLVAYRSRRKAKPAADTPAELSA